MKILSLILLGFSLSAHAQRCPDVNPGGEWIEIEHVLYYAHSHSRYADCVVKLPSTYSWGGSNSVHITSVTRRCLLKDIQRENRKQWIWGRVSYDLKISQCESNPGCRYVCEPQVSFNWF